MSAGIGAARLACTHVVSGADHGASAEVLHDVSIAFDAGRWTAIVGPNGAGKSTLLRVAAGLLAPRSGRVEWRDGRHDAGHDAGRDDAGLAQPLAALTPRERARRIAWLPQRTDGAGELTLRDVVALGRLPHAGLVGALTAKDEAAVDAAFASAGCDGDPTRRLGAVSGGERQRVLIARALAVQAPALLLDEPTTHLDPPHQAQLVRLLREQAARGVAVITVLHDLSLALLADRVVLMHGGRIAHDGAPADPALHASLARVFEGALRVVASEGRLLVVPCV